LLLKADAMDQSRSTEYAALIAACLLATSCAKRTEPKDKPTASTVPASSAGPGLTDELERLVKLSKSGSTREEQRARLKTVLEKFPTEHSKEREELIVQAVTRGAYDPPEWTTLTSNYKGRRAEIQVSTDALKILGVRIDVTAEGAQRIADALGTILPTPRILQLIWEQADVRIEPCTSIADAKMASTARMLQHSECVDQRIAGRKGVVANEGKHWVLSNRTAGKEDLAANYGWFIKGRRPIQTVGTRHDTAHTDYSQIVRLVKPMVRVDGREIDIRHVGRSPELWGLVSDEGPLLVWRASNPDATPSASGPAIATAPPPKPGDPSTVRVTLKQDRAPLGADQIPATTTALRRNTLVRRILSSLRMRPEDVPEAAYFSAGAAACGGRDVFFELMNDIPVELAELEQAKETLRRALACGKDLAPRVRAGAAVYEVEYGYEGVPSSFALLTMPDDSFRDKLLYAPLSPTPSGVHRAFCSDDAGGPRAVCQDGVRSRLMLAVNHGYLAAYAGEVPSLLDRLARSEPPPPELGELVALFREPSAAEEVAVAKGGGCGFAVDFSFVDLSPDETNRQRVLDAINDNALFCGTHSSGAILNASRRLVFVAKDETAARALQAALKQRALEVRFEPGAVVPKGSDQEAFNDAMRSAASRAARSAKLELAGRRLSMTVTLEPDATERRGMENSLDARAEKARRAAAVVLGLADGKLPAAQELGAFRAP
jgi:hypothetical protein